MKPMFLDIVRDIMRESANELCDGMNREYDNEEVLWKGLDGECAVS